MEWGGRDGKDGEGAGRAGPGRGGTNQVNLEKPVGSEAKGPGS